MCQIPYKLLRYAQFTLWPHVFIHNTYVGWLYVTTSAHDILLPDIADGSKDEETAACARTANCFNNLWVRFARWYGSVCMHGMQSLTCPWKYPCLSQGLLKAVHFSSSCWEENLNRSFSSSWFRWWPLFILIYCKRKEEAKILQHPGHGLGS